MTLENTVSNSYTYDDNYNLKTISSNGTNYTFNYDQYGNQESVYVGTNRLIQNAYNTGNGKLNSVSYENGATQSYVYNDMDLVSQLKYNNDTKFKWSYDSDGAVTRLEDDLNNLDTSYVYDDYDRII